MKKKLALPLLALTLNVLSSCGNSQNDREAYYSLKGNVKSILIQEYEVEQKFGKLEAGDLKYYPDQTKID
ncbi:MAG: hypothetical protein LBP85_10615, partial [Prevotellaceae bacterium]|nr:hypothetical protein [Prevotellaceae bacterium]